jgi:hypothetical protein
MSPASIVSPPPTPGPFPVLVLVALVLVLLMDPPAALVVCPVLVVVPCPPMPKRFDPGDAEQAMMPPTTAPIATGHCIGDVRKERLPTLRITKLLLL